MTTRGTLLVAMLGALLLSACDGGSSGTPCGDGAGTCDVGLVCQEGMCEKVPCDGVGDCPGADKACIAVEGEQVCTEAECGCIECTGCPDGEVCNEQRRCVPEGDAGGGDPDAVADATGDGSGQPDAPGDTGPGSCTTNGCPAEDRVCDPETGNCVMRPGDGCSEGSCPDGESCNTETGECEPDDTGSGDVCASCASSECPEGLQCVPLGSGPACLETCEAEADCPTGWSCQAAGEGSSVCQPASNACEGCVAEGCDANTVCNTTTGECVAGTALCEPCEEDWECGPGNVCLDSASGEQVCLARCGESGSCSGEGSCESAEGSGFQVCKGACSDDDGGGGDGCDPACSSGMVCVDGVCKQCQTDEDCTGDATCNADNQCEGGGTGACGGCPDSYPACAGPDLTGSDEAVCVKCTNDSHCQGDSCECDTESFTCVATGDGSCVSSGTGNTCESDADCDAGETDFDLSCQESTGLCVDSKARCDEQTAFCEDNKECVTPTELLGGGGGLPQLPGGGGGLPGGGGGGGGGQQTNQGTCGCDPDESLDLGGDGLSALLGPIIESVVGGDQKLGSSHCPEGYLCISIGDLFSILSQLGQGGGGGGGGDFGDQKFCFDPSSLTSGN